jgi:hypothetical protein
MSIVALIRDARADEALALEALQRRASDVWQEYRAQLAAHPDAITPPHQAMAEGRVRVAVDPAGASYLDVIANPNALGFYTRLGFHVTDETTTRFGAAPRMTLALPRDAQLRPQSPT